MIASTTSVSINSGAQANEHLEATMLLKDAVSMIDKETEEVKKAQDHTNKDYVKEIDRKMKVLCDERVHVLGGEMSACGTQFTT